MALLGRAHFSLAVATAALLLGGCAGPGVYVQLDATASVPSTAAAAGPGHTSTQQHAGQRIAQIAHGLVGTPYQYGGDHPSEGFDCSGLVFFTHRQLNLSIPRTSKDQYRVARRVALHQAQPGDLVFFTDQRKLSHVGIYLGDQRFVHAPSSGRRVSVARLDEPYYREHLVGLGRLH